jgi:hypothetical protein
MYLRFITPGAITRARVAPGFFHAAYALRDRLWPDPVAEALAIELDWFNSHLPVPRGRRAFCVRAKRRWHSDGVCWFRPTTEAREAVQRAHIMAALLQEAGVPVERLSSRRPGTILYADDLQVVAKPD